MTNRMSGASFLRGAAVVILAAVAAVALAGVSTGAGKALTKKKALKLFYTKGGADARFINVGEIFSSSTQQTASSRTSRGPQT